MIPDLVPFTWEKPTGDDGSWRVSENGRFPVFEVLLPEMATPLPVEFFARELLECDATNPESVVLLMVEHGPLIEPLRLASWAIDHYGSAIFHDPGESIRALDATNASSRGVALAEACAALGDLQDMARAALRLASATSPQAIDEDDLSWLRMLDACRGPSDVLHIDGVRLPFESIGAKAHRLTQAVCNQMFSFVMDPAPVLKVYYRRTTTNNHKALPLFTLPFPNRRNQIETATNNRVCSGFCSAYKPSLTPAW